MTTTMDPAGGSDQPAVLELHRADVGFSAAHFGVVDGRSERLHGHNYRVSLRAHGMVSADGTVVDFKTLKQALGAECALLDERMLLPTRSETVIVEANADEVQARHGNRRFSFPRGDVQLLPVTNTTCECLAAHLLKSVRARLGPLPIRLELTVEEAPGQGATVAELPRSGSAIIDS
ncbi:MAG: 6-pyruvoyl tetrahydrobiopterin synthase [Chloroflexi bacterium]|nr:MAG: 6-pyruvoyl tetrahydrobiopterin synthase [Chloroflexota bacterium]